MKPEVRDQLQRVIDGEIQGLLASRVIAEAGKEVDAAHRAFLQALSAAVSSERALAADVKRAAADDRRKVAVAHQAFLRDLNMILAAEAASRGGPKPIEINRGVEVYTMTLCVTDMSATDPSGCMRFKCFVKGATLISCTREGIRTMIDEALEASSSPLVLSAKDTPTC